MDHQNTLLALAQKIDLFRGLSPEEVGKILGKGMTMRVGKGEALFYKGTTGNQMYVLLGGKIGIYDAERLLATLHSGEMFGEMALISNEPRSASAIAVEESVVFVLNETTFQRLMTKHVAIHILLNIISTLSHRLRDANNRLRQLGTPPDFPASPQVPPSDQA